MLFHLFSPHANGYVTLPAGNGNFTVSHRPGPGTVMDMCGENGMTIIRQMNYGPNNDFVSFDAVGQNKLEHRTTVTLKAPNGHFVRPDGPDVKLQNIVPQLGRFTIRKISGSGRIRHGDTVALGAFQPYDRRRRPDAQQYRWLQADPDDNNSATKEVILGGKSLNPGGDSQRFVFFEANLVVGTANLDVSDAAPREALPLGSLNLRLSHEGLPNGSTLQIRFTSVLGQSFRFGNAGAVLTPPFDVVHSVSVPHGVNAVSLPLSVVAPTRADPVERFIDAFNRFDGPALNRADGNPLGELTVVDSGIFSWNGVDVDIYPASPRLVGVNGVRVQDYLKISFGGTEIGPTTDGVIISASRPTPRLVVSAGPRRLSAVRSQGPYYFVVSIVPFPANAHSNQITPSPLIDPILIMPANGAFSRTVNFNPIPAPTSPGGFDSYAVEVYVIPNIPRRRIPLRPLPNVMRRFGLIVQH